MLRFTAYGRPHAASIRAREILRYIGPGILITVGFIVVPVPPFFLPNI